MSTKAERRGLVTIIMAPAPDEQNEVAQRERTVVPTAALICVVSAVSRDITSPVRASSKKAARQPGEMREHIAAQIGDEAFAERSDE